MVHQERHLVRMGLGGSCDNIAERRPDIGGDVRVIVEGEDKKLPRVHTSWRALGRDLGVRIDIGTEASQRVAPGRRQGVWRGHGTKKPLRTIEFHAESARIFVQETLEASEDAVLGRDGILKLLVAVERGAHRVGERNRRRGEECLRKRRGERLHGKSGVEFSTGEAIRTPRCGPLDGFYPAEESWMRSHLRNFRP